MASFGFPFPFLPLYLNPIEKGFGYDLRIGLIATIKHSAMEAGSLRFVKEKVNVYAACLEEYERHREQPVPRYSD